MALMIVVEIQNEISFRRRLKFAAKTKTDGLKGVTVGRVYHHCKEIDALYLDDIEDLDFGRRAGENLQCLDSKVGVIVFPRACNDRILHVDPVFHA